MNKLLIPVLLFTAILFSAVNISAQSADETHIVYVQTWKMNSMPTGEEGKAFADMLKKQTDALKGNSKLLSQRIVRHNWGSDSRDLLIITEFKNLEDLFTFSGEMNAAYEKAFTKEENDKFDGLWMKYVGQHSDEIYHEVAGTRK
ncbi:MAG: hypothetical protein ABI638_09560 [Ignavibacteriota bacterium]